ncbi:MAG: antibiotic biosynthesis monooxygenase [Fuerstiella sp.]
MTSEFSASVMAIVLSKITLTGHIVVPIEDLKTVRDALAQHIALTRAEDGCLVFNVDEHAEQNGRFDVYEEFVDRHSFAAHQSRVASSHWGEVTVNVSRHYTVVGLD